VDKITLIEALITILLGATCLLARSPMRAKTNEGLIRIERLRRSRWQWFSMVVLMFLLRIQHLLPARIELLVGFQFLIFLVLPVRTLFRAQRSVGITTRLGSEHAFNTQSALESAFACSPQK